jgi:hypothetical protein
MGIFKSEHKRRILVALSDIHSGHNLGLLNPSTALQRENEAGALTDYHPASTPFQEYLWDLYQQNLKSVKDLAGKDEIIVIHNGDATQGVKYPDAWVSPRESDQIAIACANLRPWLDLPNVTKLRMIKGTSSHVMGDGSSEILIAQQLSAEYPKKSISALYHGLFSIDGFTVDVAHHGPAVGMRQWTKGNMMRYYLKSIINDALDSGFPVADLTLRAHYHTPHIEAVTRGFRQYWIAVTPSYCGLAAHGIQATRSEFQLSNGLLAFEIIDGKLVQTYPFFETLDIRTKEAL